MTLTILLWTFRGISLAILAYLFYAFPMMIAEFLRRG
jgi:hypothetical protein